MKKYFKLLKMEIRQFLRSQNFGENLVMTIFKILGFLYVAGILFASLFGIVAIARETEVDFMKIFSRFFIYWWVADLALRFMWQQLPTNNVKPLLTLNISKRTIVFYTMLKTFFSFFNILYVLYLIPLSVLFIILGYSSLQILSWFLCVIFIVLSNNFINILLNKNNIVFYSLLALTVAGGVLEYYGIFEFSAVSETLFYHFYSIVGTFILPVLLFVTLFYFSYRLIFRTFYLDEGLKSKTSVAESSAGNIEFLNRFGIMGVFLNNDISMIIRNKAVRGVALSGLLFLFYGIIFSNTKGSGFYFSEIFAGIFVTGGFMFTFGQKIPSWDSSCYPLMMTLNIPYRKYLEAKWLLMVIITFVSTLIGTLYAFVSRDMLCGVIAGGIYNLGVNSFLVMIAGVYNKTPVDLNSKKVIFSNSNSFNMKVLLLLLPQLVLPIVIYVIVRAFFGIYPALAAIFLIGFTGFMLREKAFDFIAKLYKKEKYLTINAFRKTE